MEIVRELVPGKARQLIYAAYVVGGLVVGVLSIALPGERTQTATDIMAYLAVPLAVLAGVNVPETDPYVGRWRADDDDDPVGALTD